MSPRVHTWFAAGVLVLISMVIGREVFLRLIAPAPPLNFDEAAHSLPGYYILRDILALDLRALWGDFHIQTLWPPGFSLLQAPFLGVLGVSDDSARLFAYLMLVATAIMGCALAYEIAPELAPAAGLTSGLLALSAPGWLFVGSWAMQETPVAFVTFVAFWAFLRALGSRRLRWFFLTGLALYFLFLTKFNYAAFAVAAVGLVDLSQRLRRVRSAVEGRRVTQLMAELPTTLALYLPLILGILFWFFGGTDIVPTEVKWRDFRFFVINEDSGYPLWSAENLLFYVRTTTDWLMPSPLLALATVMSAGWAMLRLRHPGVNVLAIFFGLGFVLATVHPLKAQRYITPLFPSLWLLAGLGFAHVTAHVRLMPRWRAALSVVLPFAVAAWSWWTWLPRLQPVWAGDLASDLRDASRRIVAWQQADRPVLIIGTFGELSPPLFEWRLRPLPIFAQTPLPIQYDAPPVEGPSDIGRVERWLEQNAGAQVTVIRVEPWSPLYQAADMQNKNLWRQRLARAFDEVNTYRLADEVVYTKSGLSVRYYLPK
jgi:hypothetical protein